MTLAAKALLDYLRSHPEPLERKYARAELLLTAEELDAALQELRERWLIVVDWRAGGSWIIKESEVER